MNPGVPEQAATTRPTKAQGAATARAVAGIGNDALAGLGEMRRHGAVVHTVTFSPA